MSKVKIKQNFSIKELAGHEVEIDEEATKILAKGIFPDRGLFGKWALEDFLNRRPDVTLWPSPSVKLYFVVMDDRETEVGPYAIVAEDEIKEE